MSPSPLRSYVARLALPLGLFVAAILCWTVAQRLGTVEPASAQGGALPVLTVPLVSASRLPMAAVAVPATPVTESAGSETGTQAAPPETTAELISRSLASLPQEPGGLSCVQILIDGEPVLDVRSSLGLRPSYAQLAITGHAAIDILGTDFRYITSLMGAQAPDENGALAGELFVIGGGDPVLMTQTYAVSLRPPPEARTAPEELAAALVTAGVLRIDGAVVGVDRRYDSERAITGWPQDLLAEGLVGPLGALQIDDAFELRPGTTAGLGVPSEVPAAHAAGLITQALSNAGVIVAGPQRAAATDEQLPELTTLASVVSAPLSDIVLHMLATNDASAAELMVKELGFATQGTGTTVAGGRAIQALLQGQGIDLVVPFRDGSGLDPIGGTTCSQLSRTIDGIGDEHPTLAVLPAVDMPGVFGGLLSDVEVEADLRLVGGVQGNASGLIGRTVEPDLPQITVASIINRPDGPSETDLGFQRALIELVDDLRAAITVGGAGDGGLGDG